METSVGQPGDPRLSSPFHSAQVSGMSILDISTALIWLEMEGALYRAQYVINMVLDIILDMWYPVVDCYHILLLYIV